LPKITPINSQKLIRILQKTGFKIVRQKGSHLILIDDRKTRIVIPVHPGKDIKPGLIRAIIKEAGLSRDDFFKLLKEKQ
jgi:predicted RNA binding protein YcfA (HicA-like mRNA interferase family)